MNIDIAGYSAYLLLNGRRKSTAQRHISNLKVLAKGIDRFEEEGVRDFLIGLKSNGRRGSYINSLINTASVYAQYLNIPFNIRKFKEEEFVKATMSDEEIEAFLTLPPYSGGERYKSRWDTWNLFWEICAFTGMRPGEVAKLTIDDCDLGRNVFILSVTKTNDSRLVPIPPNIFPQLNDYLNQLKGEYLFPSIQKNGVVDDVDWGYSFHSRIKRLGIRRTNLTPYSFRHSLCTRLLELETPLFTVMKLMGHRRPETTQQYSHLSVKDIEVSMRKIPAIRKFTDPRNILSALVDQFHKLFEKDDRFQTTLEDNGDEIVIRVKIKKS